MSVFNLNWIESLQEGDWLDKFCDNELKECDWYIVRVVSIERIRKNCFFPMRLIFKSPIKSIVCEHEQDSVFFNLHAPLLSYAKIPLLLDRIKWIEWCKHNWFVSCFKPRRDILMKILEFPDREELERKMCLFFKKKKLDIQNWNENKLFQWFYTHCGADLILIESFHGFVEGRD